MSVAGNAASDLTTYSLEEEPSHPYYTTTSNLTQPKRGVEVEEAR